MCGTSITDREKRDRIGVVFVACKHREVDISMKDIIKERKHDEWATEVDGRLGFVNDLRAEDAIYHKSCNSNFRTGKGNPKLCISAASQKRGTRSNVTQEDAFI